MPDPPHPKPKAHPFKAKSWGFSGGGFRQRPHDARREHDEDDDRRDTCPTDAANPKSQIPNPTFAELFVTSNFTFLTGGSHPDELVHQAAALGYRAVAVTDRNSLAGVVRAHVAAKEIGIPLVVGCRLELAWGRGETETHEGYPIGPHPGPLPRGEGASGDELLSILVYPTDRAAYGRLCQLLTLGKRRAPKGECHLTLHDLLAHHEGLLAVVIPPAVLDEYFIDTLIGLRRAFGGNHFNNQQSSIINHQSPTDAAVHPRHPTSPIRNPQSEIRNQNRLSLAASFHYGEDDAVRLQQLAALSAHTHVPLVATNAVLYHTPQRQALQDVLTCIRHGCTLDEAGFRLQVNAERHLKSPSEMARLFADYPEAIARTVEIADRATAGFNLDQLKYQYPEEVCPPGMTPMEYLKELTWKGAAERYGNATGAVALETAKPPVRAGDCVSDELPGANERLNGQCEFVEDVEDIVSGSDNDQTRAEQSDHQCESVRDTVSGSDRRLRRFENHHATCADLLPDHIRQQIEHEFELIDELNYAPYFLTVHDLVVFARSRGILCQGRGAAANSAVCYCLGVTAVDPARVDLLFERFISRERNEPPDIDIDFEHERREEVIQYIYEKYGRHRAALTAEVITYRGRSAVREVGKALGLSLDCVDRLAKNLDWWEHGVVHPERIAELGLNPDDPTIQHLLRLVHDILGFPRHLSQHVGGFVITQGPLCELVPIENAAMENRTVIEWDKDDIDAMNMLKVDCLGLGMLTCIRKCFALIEGAKVQRGKGAKARKATGRYDSETYYPLSQRSTNDERTSDSNLSRSDCVTEGDGIDTANLSNYSANAKRRTIRADDADAPSGGVRSVQHRGRAQSSGAQRLHPVSQNGARITRRVDDTGRTGDKHGDDSARQPVSIALSRDGSSASGVDYESGEVEAKELGAEVQRDKGAKGRKGSTPFEPLNLCPFEPSVLALHTIPPEDPDVYNMICNADTIGVFQIESRAQMQMLPRLRPRNYYDLVIEVAIVRPGPIQGDMVHPYLRRRNKEEPVTYPDERVKKVLGKTLGVPLFQEQAMALAIVAAGFTPGEADQLRRAIAAWKSRKNVIFTFGRKLIDGMVGNGYDRDFAERCFRQIQGFSEYGFPESHAASFALLVYVSAWLKCHHPAAFAAALINSQPMGFYAPAQIVRDAQQHGVEVRAVDVNFSGWDCRLEEGHAGEEVCLAPGLCPASPALRLGMRLIKGMRQEHGDALADAVAQRGPFDSIDALWRVSGVPVATLRRLAQADAFGSMGLDRQAALWQVRELRDEPLPLFDGVEKGQRGKEAEVQRARLAGDRRSPRAAETPLAGAMGKRVRELTRAEDGAVIRTGKPQKTCGLPMAPEETREEHITLPPISLPRKVVHDYASVGLSLKAHPVSFIRERLNELGVTPAVALRDEDAWPHGKPVVVAGLVLVRQRPGTASGVVFVTLEDETDVSNLIIRPRVFERDRRAARHATVMLARGRIERQGQVVHVMTQQVQDVSRAVTDLMARSRDFR